MKPLLALFSAARVRVVRPLILSLLVATFVACGAPPTTDPPAPAGGVLRVKIAGLPSGTPAAVKVIGADQIERTVTTDTDLQVPVGSYVVKGAAVGSGEKNAPAYTPVGKPLEVSVSSSAGANALVTYQQVVTEISSQTRVLDDAASATLVSIVKATSGRATLTFSGGNAQVAALQVGDILKLGSSTAAPEGHFGRVVSSAGGVVVTDPAAMQDVVQNGAFVYSQRLNIASKGVVLPQGVKPSALENCVDLNTSKSANINSGGVVVATTIQTSGALCLSADVNLRVTLNKDLKPSVDFGITTSIDSNLKVNVTANAATPPGATPLEFPPFETPLLVFKFPKFTVWTGPVPWIIIPTLSVPVGVSGTVAGGVKFSLETKGNAGAGFNYNADNNQFSPWSSKSITSPPSWPLLSSAMNLKAYVAPDLAMIIDGVTGPFIGFEPFVRFNATFNPSANWKLYTGVNLQTGMAPVFDIALGYSYDFFTVENEILSSTGTPPVGQPVGTAPNIAANEGMVVAPDNTVYVGSGSVVRAYTSGVSPKWVYATGNSSGILGVSRGDDGTVYAWDFGGTLYAINANGTERWKTAALGNLELRRIAITNSGVIVTAGGQTVRTFAAATGVAGWSKDVGESVYAIAIDQSGNIWSNGSTSLYKLAAVNGTISSTIAAPSSPGGLAMASNGTVYVRTSDTLTAIGSNGTVAWSSTLPFADGWSAPAIGPDGTIYLCGTTDQGRLYAVNPANGSEKWTHYHNQLCEATPSVGDDGRVYIVTDKSVRAINASNGTPAWNLPAGSGNTGTSSSPVFLTNKAVVFGTNTGLTQVYAGAQLAPGTWAREGGDSSGSGRGK